MDMYAFCAFIPKPGHETFAAPLIQRCIAFLTSERHGYSSVSSRQFHVLEKRCDKSAMRGLAFARDRGVVLGTLFRNDSETPVFQLPETDAKEIILSGGQALLAHFWGRYAAFIMTPTGPIVISDPTGGTDCYWHEHRHFYCFFSDPDDFADLGLCPVEINWAHVQRHIQNPVMDQPDTGLQYISKLHGGEKLSLGTNGITRSSPWDPSAIAHQNVITSHEDAAELLRDTVIRAVRSWAEAYERFIVQLSGGLDSSIVLACLAGHRSLSGLTCINYHSGTADSDERRYARHMADRVGTRLYEINEAATPVNLADVLNFKFSAVPMMALANLLRGDEINRLASRHRARAVLDGHGGDEVFGRLMFYGAATDYLWQNGLDAAFWSVAHDSARLARTTVWSVIGSAIKNRLTGHCEVGPPPHEKFIAHLKHVLPNYQEDDGEERTFSSRMGQIEQLPPGKRLHIRRTLVANRSYYPSRPEHQLERVHPLLSQPVLEAVFRIPTYLFSFGAKQRGLARYAFQHQLPSDVVFRQTKGGINNFTDDVFRHNFEFLKTFFLDSVLCKEGLLNRQAIEQAFQSEVGQGGAMKTTLLSCLGAEAWLRHWSARSRLYALSDNGPFSQCR